MSTTSESETPFYIYAERMGRNIDRPWRVTFTPQLLEGKAEWCLYDGSVQDPKIYQNTLRPTYGSVGDVVYIDPRNDTFRVLFNALNPTATGCSFPCKSITNFDEKPPATHMLSFKLSDIWSSIWSSVPSSAQVLPDPDAAVETTIVGERLKQRVLNFSGVPNRKQWAKDHIKHIVRAYPDVTRDALYIVTQSVTEHIPSQTTSPRTLTFPLDVYPENMPPHMRGPIEAAMQR